MLVHQQLFNLSDRECWFRADSQRSFSESVDICVTNGILDLTSEGFFERYRKAIVDELLKYFRFFEEVTKSPIIWMKVMGDCSKIVFICCWLIRMTLIVYIIKIAFVLTLGTAL